MPQLDMFLKALAEEIKAQRRTRNMSQEKLADVTGFHRTYISGIERAKINLTIGNLLRIAEALDLSLHEILPNIPTKGYKTDDI